MTESVDIVFQIGRLRKALRQRFDACAAPMGITVPQFQVLRRLWEQDGLLTCTLMRDSGLDAGTITGIINRLEAKGLVRRVRAEEDRRAVAIYLTPAGREMEAPLAEVMQAVADEAVAGLGPVKRSELLDLLQRMGENLGA